MKQRCRRSGLTLLELVVVLAILSAVTLVAVLATESTLDQARYDVTQRTLENIETAILGPADQTESRGTVGFLADVGRLPLTVGADQASGVQLSELWANPRALRPYGRAVTSDPNLTLFSGWRGPYLRVPGPAGLPTRLLDGWGNSFQTLASDDTTLLNADQPVGRVQSLGGAQSPYNLPLRTTRSLNPADSTGVLAGSVTDAVPSSAATVGVEVRLFVPDGTTANGVREYVRTFGPDGTDTATSRTGFQFVFPDTTLPAEAPISLAVGPKVLKVSQPGTSRVKVVHFWLPSGGSARTEALDLQ